MPARDGANVLDSGYKADLPWLPQGGEDKPFVFLDVEGEQGTLGTSTFNMTGAHSRRRPCLYL